MAASANSLELYITDLGGDNEQARATARQMLPREGAAAVPYLLPLLKSENQNVWRAAFNVLEDIANNVSVPGREKDRLAVTDSLMTLVNPNEPYAIKERGLRLLPKVVPNGYDIHPISALLKDQELREKARAALEEMGTPEASAALCNALPSADPDFARALLDAIGAIRNPASLASIQPLLSHSDAGVRAAALRALSWTGDPGYLKAGSKVFSQADKSTEAEAGDAYLRLADSVLRKGGNFDAGLKVYREVLKESSDRRLQAAAMAGMGRFGDETVVPVILETVQGGKAPDLEGPAWVALSALEGQGASKALLAAFPTFTPEMKIPALAAFGRKRDPIFLDLLTETLRSEDSAIHEVCAIALADSHFPEAVPLLVSDAGTRSGEEKEATLKALQQLAYSMRLLKNRQAAGDAYYALYQAAESDDLKNTAFEGIHDFPVAASLNLLLEKVESTDVMDPAQVTTMLGIVKSLSDAGRKDEAATALDRIIGKVKSPEALRAAIPALAGIFPGLECTRRLGFVTKWQVVGGFSWSMNDGFQKVNIGEPNVDLSATYKVGENQVSWKPYETKDPSGGIDFSSAVGMLDHVTGYAYAKISVAEETEGTVRVGSDDGIKVWVNGASVHENNVDRGSAVDQDQAPIKLKAGANDLLIEVTQGGGGWNAFVRLTKPDGMPLSFACE
jgi:HEAT repeat protein